MTIEKDNAITFTKKDVTRQVASKLGVPTSRIIQPVAAVFDVMRDILSQDHPNIRLEIRNFGTLEVKPTKAKPQARNPRTNEVIYVPPRRKTHFKPGRILRGKLKQPLSVLNK